MFSNKKHSQELEGDSVFDLKFRAAAQYKSDDIPPVI